MSDPVPTGDPARDLLRHCLATVAYRVGKAVRDAPPELADFRLESPGELPSRSPVEILAHMGDLYDWAWSMAAGAPSWTPAPPLAWEGEIERFFAALDRFDRRLADGEPLGCRLETLFQGPVADSLQHVGQITYLRRLAGFASVEMTAPFSMASRHMA